MQFFSIGRILAIQLLLLFIAVTACRRTAPEPFPEEMLGLWGSDHAQYKDRYIEIRSATVTFGSDNRINLIVFIRNYRKEEQEGEWTLFCEDREGVDINLFPVMQMTKGGALLKFKNQQHVIWKKLEENLQTAETETQSEESNTPGIETIPVVNDSIATGTQQAEQDKEPAEQPVEIIMDEVESVLAEGDLKASGTQQIDQSQKPDEQADETITDGVETKPVTNNLIASRIEQTEQKKEPQIPTQMKPLQPRKVVLGLKPNSLELTDEGRTALDAFLTKLKRYPRATVWVKGYVSAKTNSAENLELSTKRARAIERLMIDTGIEPIQIEIIGMGNKDPIASNDTRAGRKKNRRVEIEVISDGTELKKR